MILVLLTIPFDFLDSEPSFFHYRNRIEAERSYLLFEAVPDWQSKLARLEHSLLYDPVIRSLISTPQISKFDSGEPSGSDILEPLYQWFSKLKSEILGLRSQAERTHVPDFDTTIHDFETYYLECQGANATIHDSSDIERRDSGIELDARLDQASVRPKEGVHDESRKVLERQKMDERRDSGIEMEV